MTTNNPCSCPNRYLIRKQGYFYRPNSHGYTQEKHAAGRYTLADAEKITHPNGPDGPRDGMSFVHESEVPDDPQVAAPLACTGCGNAWTEAELAAIRANNPKILSCCPERNMQPMSAPDTSTKRAVELAEAAEVLLISLPLTLTSLRRHHENTAAALRALAAERNAAVAKVKLHEADAVMQNGLAQKMMRERDAARAEVVALREAILDREHHDWGLVPIRLRIMAMKGPPA